MKVLVTGVTGSGKTTIADALSERRLAAYDTDAVENLSRWEDADGLPVKGQEHPPKEWYEHNFWNWNKDKLAALLDQPKDVYLCGISSNLGKFYGDFDKVFLLQINQKDMEHRLHTREKNSFGRDPEALASIISWHKSFEQDAIKNGAIVIDATLPLDDVVDKILEVVHGE